MFDIKRRSVEGWGPLAEDTCDDVTFASLVNRCDGITKKTIKEHVARKKKLKKFRVNFIRNISSEDVIIEAESEYDVTNRATQFFRENRDTIKFQQPVDWPRGYDQLRYTKVR